MSILIRLFEAHNGRVGAAWLPLQTVQTGLKIVLAGAAHGLRDAVALLGRLRGNARGGVAQGLVEINSNLVKDLVKNLLALLLVVLALEHGIVNSVVHHLLALVHDIVFALEFHGDTLQAWQVHAPVHGAQEPGGAAHAHHHLLVCAHGLDPQ